MEAEHLDWGAFRSYTSRDISSFIQLRKGGGAHERAC